MTFEEWWQKQIEEDVCVEVTRRGSDGWLLPIGDAEEHKKIAEMAWEASRKNMYDWII